MLSSSQAMIKELIITITLGAIFGFGLTGGFITLKKTNKTQLPPPNNNPPQTQISPTVTTQDITITPLPTKTETGQFVNIETPENESIVSNSKTKLRGSTSQDSMVIIKTPVKSYSVQADKTGQFELDIELETGVNFVKISSFDPQDNEANLELLITYSTSKI